MEKNRENFGELAAAALELLGKDCQKDSSEIIDILEVATWAGRALPLECSDFTPIIKALKACERIAGGPISSDLLASVLMDWIIEED